MYNEVTPAIKLGGPTNFAPLIEEAVNIVKRTRQVTISVFCFDRFSCTSSLPYEYAISENQVFFSFWMQPTAIHVHTCNGNNILHFS